MAAIQIPYGKTTQTLQMWLDDRLARRARAAATRKPMKAWIRARLVRKPRWRHPIGSRAPVRAGEGQAAEYPRHHQRSHAPCAKPGFTMPLFLEEIRRNEPRRGRCVSWSPRACTGRRRKRSCGLRCGDGIVDQRNNRHPPRRRRTRICASSGDAALRRRAVAE